MARPDLFTFYEDNNANMPAGSDRVSKSVILLQGVNPAQSNSGDGQSTAFIIRTFRDDDLMCVCMAGHQVRTFNGNRIPPSVPFDLDIKNLISMDYKAKNYISPTDGATYVGPHEAASSYLSQAQVVAYFWDPPSSGTGNDAALLLINKRKLPSGNFVALGYDFGAINMFNYQNYFTIGHPCGYPQRLAKDLLYYDDGNNWIEFEVAKPYATAPGSSGAPLINTTTLAVQGIHSYISNPVTFYATSVAGWIAPYSYALVLGFTRMSLLESAIKEHCWKNANKEQILSSGIYKQSVEVSNPKLNLLRNTNLSISFSADIPGSSSAFTEDALDGKKVTQLTANNCTIGSFTLPVAYPGTTATPWRVVVSANKVDVNAGFNYTASGTSELDLTTLETYTRSATSRLADAADTASNSSVAGSGNTPGFKLYPNPSPDGVFFLELPAAEKDIVYTGSIMSADGKLVQQLDHMPGGQKVSFNLSRFPKGMYVLNVHDPEGKRVFTVKIVL
ncbi:hypothetical protein GCM10023092_27040 [Rurimicrobium arvi]|uniref:Secretion system C-terminal sorting domain-containing protein n=2 Tax=Rurimicrobium arvi TaxID=2049916 RepID=A0ABP8N1Z8_9BACT